MELVIDNSVKKEMERATHYIFGTRNVTIIGARTMVFWDYSIVGTMNMMKASASPI